MVIARQNQNRVWTRACVVAPFGLSEDPRRVVQHVLYGRRFFLYRARHCRELRLRYQQGLLDGCLRACCVSYGQALFALGGDQNGGQGRRLRLSVCGPCAEKT